MMEVKIRMMFRGIAIAACLAVCVLAVARGFNEKEVVVWNADDGIGLAGTLTVSGDGAQPRAAIVMATGSGQQNRDEEIFGHRPFKVIAEYLSERGYAVLRLDDRGVGGSGGDPKKSTTDDYVRDIAAGISYLDSCFTGVPVGVIGHSEGGTVAIQSAARNQVCKFIITLAAPAWEGDSIVMSQARATTEAMTGRWDGEALQRRLLDVAKSDIPSAQAKMMIYLMVAETLGEAVKMPAVQQQLNQQVDVMVSPWYRSMLRYNPADDIRAVCVPWLALNGDRDMQVLPENLATIGRLNPGATTVLLPAHNHLFQRCTTGLPQEYATIAEDISDDTLSEIFSWLKTVVND